MFVAFSRRRFLPPPYSPLQMAKGGKRGVRVTRNPELVPGVRRYGAVASAKRSATYKHTKKGLGKSTPHQAPVRADKMDGKFYAADDTKVALRSHRGAAKVAKLRKSIRPGTVVIVLAGRFRGKRVIVLKQLKQSGMLLVTGQRRAQQQRAESRCKRQSRERIAIESNLLIDVSAMRVGSLVFFAALRSAPPLLPACALLLLSHRCAAASLLCSLAAWIGSLGLNNCCA